ncbi:MAG: M16 family metallopeptidase [Myxococcota bacterium]
MVEGDALVRELNREVRRRTAKLRHEGTLPFGDALRIDRYRLGNGLGVLVVPDRSAPVVSYHTWFRVGSRHEQPGKTGLAHLFEHLMFNETEHLAAGEFDRLLEAAGGETNAATWTDWTFYYENLPKKSLELAVRLEADRMAHLVLRDEQVTSEKEVVANERRYRVDDDVEGAANEKLYALAFRKHPYHWPTIGWMRDIEGFTIDDCRAFYRTYYAPNNATVVVVGDVDPREVLGLIQAHYGGYRPARLPEERPVAEPAQRRERRRTLHLPSATEKLHVGYRAPALGDADWVPLTLANDILFGGRSSRVYRRLVDDTEVAAECRGSLAPFRDPGLHEVWVGMRPGKAAADALALVDEELERLRREPPTEAELEKAKNRYELGFLHGMETANGKAEQIGFYETVLGDPGLIFARLEAYRRVTVDDVQRVARRYFDCRRRTVLTVLPAGGKNEKGNGR